MALDIMYEEVTQSPAPVCSANRIEYNVEFMDQMKKR